MLLPLVGEILSGEKHCLVTAWDPTLHRSENDDMNVDVKDTSRKRKSSPICGDSTQYAPATQTSS